MKVDLQCLCVCLVTRSIENVCTKSVFGVVIDFATLCND